MPLLLETMTLMPVSTKGTENSTTSDLSSLMVREPMAMSALLDTTWRTTRSQLALRQFTPHEDPALGLDGGEKEIQQHRFTS